MRGHRSRSSQIGWKFVEVLFKPRAVFRQRGLFGGVEIRFEVLDRQMTNFGPVSEQHGAERVGHSSIDRDGILRHPHCLKIG